MTMPSIWKEVSFRPTRSCLENGGCSHSARELTASVPLDTSFLPAWFGVGACLAALLPYATPALLPGPSAWTHCSTSSPRPCQQRQTT